MIIEGRPVSCFLSSFILVSDRLEKCPLGCSTSSGHLAVRYPALEIDPWIGQMERQRGTLSFEPDLPLSFTLASRSRLCTAPPPSRPPTP